MLFQDYPSARAGRRSPWCSRTVDRGGHRHLTVPEMGGADQSLGLAVGSAARLLAVTLTKFWDRPEDMVGGIVPDWFTLTKTSRFAIIVSEIVAFPNGFSLTVTNLPRPGHRLPSPLPKRANDGLVFSVHFADGSSGTAADTEHLLRYWSDTMGDLEDLEVPPEPFVRSQGYGISPRRHQFHYWVAPLPPRGPLTLAVTWRSARLPRTEFTLDGVVVLNAAAKASRIWED